MRIKNTTWYPDTCECVIVYSWDADSREDERKHTVVSHQYCGQLGHPIMKVGEQVEDSDFHKHHRQVKKVMEDAEKGTIQ